MSEANRQSDAILAEVQKQFTDSLKQDKRLMNLAKRIRDGTNYSDANDYAVRLGELLSEALTDNTAGFSYVARDIAEAVLPPMFKLDYDLMSVVVQTVQNNINKAAGIGLAAQVPEYDAPRIAGLIDAVANTQSPDQLQTMLAEPVVNFTQSIVDYAVRDNARVQSKAGLQAYIVRSAEAYKTVTRPHIVRSKKGKIYTYNRTYTEPCKWCAALAGRYVYDEVRDSGNDVFRRHESCRCTVTYELGKQRTDAWTKATWTDADAQNSRQLIQQRTEELQRQRAQQAANTEKRLNDVQTIMQELGYSARGASIFRNANKADIERYGLDFVIDRARNAR